MEPILRAQGLCKEFPAKNGKKLQAVAGVDLELFPGQTLALVGESGCGKSTLGRLLLNLWEPTEGTVYLEDTKITGLSRRAFAPYRRQMQLIFQDPYSSLDPRMKVLDLIAEPLRAYRVCRSQAEYRQRVASLLQAVELPPEAMDRYAHQFSGGQRQRIGIARALALEPRILVCDEPVSALDVSVQSQVLNLLRRLQKERGLTMLFISHDLSVVRFMADRVCVMFLGKICEKAPAGSVYTAPRHPYTKFLLNAIPKADPRARNASVELLTGEAPSPLDPPTGCRFHPRCPYATDRCRTQEPALRPVGPEHLVACHYAE